MNLTQKILLLDANTSKALENAESSILAQEQEEDTHFAQLKEEQERSFEYQKREESAALTKKLQAIQQKALSELGKKMQEFNEKMAPDRQVEQLLSVAMDQVCR